MKSAVLDASLYAARPATVRSADSAVVAATACSTQNHPMPWAGFDDAQVSVLRDALRDAAHDGHASIDGPNGEDFTVSHDGSGWRESFVDTDDALVADPGALSPAVFRRCTGGSVGVGDVSVNHEATFDILTIRIGVAAGWTLTVSLLDAGALPRAYVERAKRAALEIRRVVTKAGAGYALAKRADDDGGAPAEVRLTAPGTRGRGSRWRS